MLDSGAAARTVTESLTALSDAPTATAMAAYMKSEMPCFGVKKPQRAPILRRLRAEWVPATRNEYVDLVTAVWRLPHREEKYLAIGVARAHEEHVTVQSLPLYREMIVTGGWWDFVDEIAIRLVGRAMQKDRVAVTPLVRTWNDDPDLWLRRTSIICQIAHKDETDPEFLFEMCAARAHETDFFIRKAVGWALRAYAYVDPGAVRRFVDRHELSGLSRREATKHL